MDARTTALSALIACRKQGAWADGILKEYIVRDKLDKRDAALASRLCYGVLQNKMLIDYYIGCCLSGSIKNLQPIVLDILRLGMYQIMMMDKIPVSAAVNEAVKLTKKYANQRASGLVNGVLRHAIREKSVIPIPQDLAIRYSHPRELVELLEEAVGSDSIESLLSSHNEIPRTVVQVNPLRCDTQEAQSEFEQLGIEYEAHPWLPGTFYVSGTGNIESLGLFKRGALLVQDPAARLAVVVAGVKPGMRVLDGCAAPGGKSFAAAMLMRNEGSIVSCDIHKHKIDLLAKGSERLGISIIDPRLQDGRKNQEVFNDSMDLVIADVPCSGLGVIRKKPDIRYKDLKGTEDLPQIQIDILNNLSRYVKPGGILLYSTCTILPRENENVAERFLSTHDQFELLPFDLPEELGGGCNGMFTLLPSVHNTDGFFICKMRRKA